MRRRVRGAVQVTHVGGGDDDRERRRVGDGLRPADDNVRFHA